MGYELLIALGAEFPSMKGAQEPPFALLIVVVPWVDACATHVADVLCTGPGGGKTLRWRWFVGHPAYSA